MRILLVEDDRDVAEYIRRDLEDEGYAVSVCHDGAEGLRAAERAAFDIIVLDVMLPFMDGLEVTRRLRRQSVRTPILLLTARDAPEEIVRGLDAGADDYLVKPFAIEELTARLRALLRRRTGTATPVLSVGDLQLDPASHTVRRGAHLISLTAREYALLEYLMRHPGIVHTRTMIAEHVWDFPFDHASNVVDVYVKHLRDKIDSADRRSFIQAVRGVGYVLDDPDTADPS